MMGRDQRWNPRVTLLLVLLAAGVAACSDDGVNTIGPRSVTTPPGSPRTGRAALACTATLHPLQTVCKPVGGGANVDSRMRRYVVVGKQNVYVTFATSGYTFNTTTNVFTFSATIQNLMTQPIGTQNGSALAGTGVDAFFTAGPSSETGVGTVTPESTATGTFTASGQKYYEYAQVLQPNAVSSPKTWYFQLSPGVTSFNFYIEVAADMPAEGSVYRWTPIRQGITDNQLNAVWESDPNNVFAVGLNGTVLYYNGATWSQLLTAAGYRARGVSGSSPTDVWFVADSSITGHYNGSTFTNVAIPVTASLKGVYELGSNNIYTVGGGTIGGTTVSVMLHSANGTSWTDIAAPHGVVDTLRAVWASDATHIFAVGDAGRLLLWNGTAWTQYAKPTGNPPFRGVWGTSATNVFAVATTGAIYQFNGTTWTAMTSGVTTELDAIGGTSGSDIWAVGVDGVTIHYNGTQWSTVAPVVGLSLHGVTANATAPWAVGDNGALVQYTGGAWTLSNQSGVSIKRIWASSASDVWASAEGTMLHYDGTNWTSYYVSPADTMFGLVGFSSTDVHTIGFNGNVSKWNGTSWVTSNINLTANWYAEWGSPDSSTLCAVGSAGQTYCNAFGTVIRAGGVDLRGIWGSSDAVLYTVSVNGSVYKSANSGQTWAAMTSPTVDTLFGIFGSSATAIWAVGQAGTVIANTGTNTWTAQASGTTNDLNWVWADPPPGGYTADVYAVGNAGTIVHYNGTGWSAMSSGVTANLRAVYGTSTTNVYIGGDNGVVLLGTQ